MPVALGVSAFALVWFPLRIGTGSPWAAAWGTGHDVVVGLLGAAGAVSLVRVLARDGLWFRDIPLVYFALCVLSVVQALFVPTLGLGYVRMQVVTLATFASMYLCAHAASQSHPVTVVGILAAWFSWATASALRAVIQACLSGRTLHDAVDAMGHTNSRAGFEMGVALFLFGIVLRGRGAWRRAAAFLLVVLSASLVLSMSRGAWLGLLAGAITGVWLQWGWKRAAAAALVAVAVVVAMPGPLGERARTVLEAGFPTNLFRLRIWRETLSLISENPWGGVGYDTLWFAVLARLGSDLATLAGRHVHNLALQTWAEVGLLGLASLGAVFVAALRLVHRLESRREAWMASLGRGLALYLVGTIAHNLVDCTWRDYGQQIVFWGLIGWLFALGERGGSPR